MISKKKQKEIDRIYEEFNVIPYTNLSVRMKEAVERMARKIIKLRKQKQRLVQRNREQKKGVFNEND